MASESAPFGVPSYKISKAALNMLTVNYASDLANESFTVIAINPGVSAFVLATRFTVF